MSVAPRDLLFYAGGECLERFGTLVWRPRQAMDAVPTITRTGAARIIGPDGVLRSVSANRARVSHPLVDGVRVPSLLLEGARTNLVTSDDLTAWTASGTPVVTGSVSDPAGGTTAYTVADDDGSATEFVQRTVSFTGDAAKAVTFVVRENTMPATGVQSLRLRDATAAANILVLDISGWVDGGPTVAASTGTLLGKRYVGGGYWAIYGRATVTAANSNSVIIIPATTVAETGSIDVYRVNAFNAAAPPSLPLDASGAQNAETFYAPFTPAPQEMTVYVSMIEAGNNTTAGILQIGTATGAADERLLLFRSISGGYRAGYNNGSGLVNTAALTQPIFGQSFELMLTLAADGTITISQSIEGATATSASIGTGGALPAAWDAQRLYINSTGTGNIGLGAYRSVKVASGTKTLAEMGAVFP